MTVNDESVKISSRKTNVTNQSRPVAISRENNSHGGSFTREMAVRSLRNLAFVTLALSLTTAGFFAGMVRERSAKRSTPGVEYFYAPKTFSELENTAALLDAECDELIAEVRSENGVSMTDDSANAIRELTAAREQLRGSKQELAVTEELLWFLKKAGQTERWLEIYSEVLYERPTDPLIGRFAEDAVRLARGTPRQDALLRAFEFVSDMPITWDAKAKVQAVLMRNGGLALAGAAKSL